MTEIIRCDNNGRLISIAKKTVPEKYQNIVSSITKDILEKAPESLRSIIVRGSVARNNVIEGVSDLDMVLVLQNSNSEFDTEMALLALKETRKWNNIFPLVDLSCTTIDEVLYDSLANRLKMNIKLSALVVWGDDIVSQIPDIYMDAELAKRISYQTYTDCINTERRIKNRECIDYMGVKRGCDFLCVWFMRDFLRGLIAPLIIKEKVFSLNVQTCGKLFCESFPQHRELIERCCAYEITPVDSWDELYRTVLECNELYLKICKEMELLGD